MTTTRVLIVEDENLVRVGLKTIINAEPDLEVVGEAADGTDVAAMVDLLRPDVVLMSIRMPAVDGIEATSRIIEKFEDPPRILMLTTLENDDEVYEALRAGASGFLLKRSQPDRIVYAVRLLMEGDSLLLPMAVRDIMMRQQDGRAPRCSLDVRLTTREAEVLRLMARGLSNAEIAKRLMVRMETVKTHVSNVLTKLRARDRTQAVVFAYESRFIEPN